MTTTTKKKASKSKHAAPKKPLRIRPELLPETATYGTFANKEYVMIPVEDFGEWYEDIALGAIAEDRIDSSDEPPIPLEEYLAEKNGKLKAGK